MKLKTILRIFASLFDSLSYWLARHEKQQAVKRRKARREAVETAPSDAFSDLFGAPERVSEPATESDQQRAVVRSNATASAVDQDG